MMGQLWNYVIMKHCTRCYANALLQKKYLSSEWNALSHVLNKIKLTFKTKQMRLHAVTSSTAICIIICMLYDCTIMQSANYVLTILQYQAKRLAGKNVSKMTYFTPCIKQGQRMFCLCPVIFIRLVRATLYIPSLFWFIYGFTRWIIGIMDTVERFLDMCNLHSSYASVFQGIYING